MTTATLTTYAEAFAQTSKVNQEFDMGWTPDTIHAKTLQKIGASDILVVEAKPAGEDSPAVEAVKVATYAEVMPHLAKLTAFRSEFQAHVANLINNNLGDEKRKALVEKVYEARKKLEDVTKKAEEAIYAAIDKVHAFDVATVAPFDIELVVWDLEGATIPTSPAKERTRKSDGTGGGRSKWEAGEYVNSKDFVGFEKGTLKATVSENGVAVVVIPGHDTETHPSLSRATNEISGKYSESGNNSVNARLVWEKVG